MKEKFIERGTEYLLEQGTLTVYETNCTCRDVKFYFEKNTLTLMLSGHKSITTDNLNFEFFPGTFYIPERKCIHKVDIHHASFDNPTKCLVLDLRPSFIEKFYQELVANDEQGKLLFNEEVENNLPYFFSNDDQIIEVFIRLYRHARQEQTKSNEMIGTLILKELLLRLFQTRGLSLLMENFDSSVHEKEIQKSISYIKSHLQQKISVEQLADVSDLGVTTFYRKFKSSTGFSPADYILRERINLSKIMIQKGQGILKEVAFKSGFNSYEYFCNSFKKLEKVKPLEYKRKMA